MSNSLANSLAPTPFSARMVGAPMEAAGMMNAPSGTSSAPMSSTSPHSFTAPMAVSLPM